MASAQVVETSVANNSPSQDSNHPDDLFQSKLVTIDDVRATIMHSSSASCGLDPIPTWLLKMCVDELAPVTTKMVNLSLHEGLVPERWKVALIDPLLKKVNLKPIFRVNLI